MDLHIYQLSILKGLTFKKVARFSEIKNKSITSEHFTYHLKELLKLELIKKRNKFYSLTNKGKTFIEFLDIDSLSIEKLPKVSVLVYIHRKTKQGNTEYLLMKRKKAPYFGKVGNLTGKVRFGDSCHATAVRELKEETGLTANLKLTHIYRKIRTTDNKKTIQDNIFFVFLGKNPKGKLISNNEADYFWITLKDLYKRKDLFDDVKSNFDKMLKNKFTYTEESNVAKGF